jgi:ABC-type lipoprotein export system ATPase subunit
MILLDTLGKNFLWIRTPKEFNINNLKLILADEPTGNLDSRNGTEVMQILTDLNEKGSTVIMVTFNIYL